MRDEVVAVLEGPIDTGIWQHHTSYAADGEHEDKADRQQYRRLELNRATPHDRDPRCGRVYNIKADTLSPANRIQRNRSLRLTIALYHDRACDLEDVECTPHHTRQTDHLQRKAILLVLSAEQKSSQIGCLPRHPPRMLMRTPLAYYPAGSQGEPEWHKTQPVPYCGTSLLVSKKPNRSTLREIRLVSACRRRVTSEGTAIAEIGRFWSGRWPMPRQRSSRPIGRCSRLAQITQPAALALFYGAAVPNLREQLQGHISGRPVVNASGKLIGIVSQGDFTRRGNGEAAVAVSACSFDPLSWGIGVQN